MEDELIFDDTCPDCGSDMEWIDCYNCGGEGGFDGEELIMVDPLWYDPDDYVECGTCDGNGGWFLCLLRCENSNKTEERP